MPRPPGRRRLLALVAGTLLCGGLGVGLGSCSDAGVGVDPPDDRLFFPTGMLLDPRVAEDQPARFLFVTNANSDLVFNAATVVAVDLDKFTKAWSDPAKVAEVGAEVDAKTPCRRNAITPQLIECTEESFIRKDATVHLSSFTSVIRAWDREPEKDGYQLGLLIPVRSEPSVATIDVDGDPAEDVEFRCDAGSDPDERDPLRCGRDRRIRYFRGDPDYLTLGREPANILISPKSELPLAYITHSELAIVTLVRLTGLLEPGTSPDPKTPKPDPSLAPPRPKAPTIVDYKQIISVASPLQYGGYGLAERPCYPGNAPALATTELGECARPLLYASYRRDQYLVRFTVEAPTPAPDQFCVYAEQLETGDYPGAILCEEQIVGIDVTYAGGFDPGSTTSGASIYGDIAFSSDGNSLYIVQTNPGALLRLDTSLDERGAVRDLPAGVVEVCQNPTEMLIFDDAIHGVPKSTEYAAISCYGVGMIFIVDLSAFRVVKSLGTGAGPHHMVFDRARGYVYVANTLDATLGVIDVSPIQPTRFTEVARLGLQEPYTG
ncbi:MAG: hypothetical protein R3B09_19910 [Nannocystaceae bacterium]